MDGEGEDVVEGEEEGVRELGCHSALQAAAVNDSAGQAQALLRPTHGGRDGARVREEGQADADGSRQCEQ